MSRCCRFLVPPVSKNQYVAVPPKIDPVARAEIDPILKDALADGFDVRKVALLQPDDRSGNLGACYRLQIRKPFGEWLMTVSGDVVADFEHEVW